jgi:hypothetical protein
MDAPLVAVFSNLRLFFLAVLNRTEPEFSDKRLPGDLTTN